MNLLGVPVILGIDSKIKAQEKYLEELKAEQAKYVDMIETYKYSKEVGFGGTVEAKDQQFPDDITITTEIETSYNEKYGTFIKPIVMIHNSGEYDLQIFGIETKYTILGGDDYSVEYPLSQLGSLHDPSDLDNVSKFKGFLYKLFNGEVLIYDVNNYIGSAKGIGVIKSGETRVFYMPSGYGNILNSDGNGDVNKAYSNYLYQNGGVSKGGESTDVTLFWKSTNPDNPGGRCIFVDCRGDVYEYVLKMNNLIRTDE